MAFNLKGREQRASARLGEEHKAAAPTTTQPFIAFQRNRDPASAACQDPEQERGAGGRVQLTPIWLTTLQRVWFIENPKIRQPRQNHPFVLWKVSCTEAGEAVDLPPGEGEPAARVPAPAELKFSVLFDICPKLTEEN